MANYGSGWEELGRVILLRGRVIMVLDTGQVPTVAHHLLLVIYRKYLSFLMYMSWFNPLEAGDTHKYTHTHARTVKLNTHTQL